MTGLEIKKAFADEGHAFGTWSNRGDTETKKSSKKLGFVRLMPTVCAKFGGCTFLLGLG